MHLTKRRKLGESSSTLSKPFRSPIRVDTRAQAHQIANHEQTVPDHSAKVIDHTLNPYAGETEAEHNSAKPPTAVLALPSRSSNLTSTLAHLLSSRRDPERDADYLLLQKRRSALVLQLSKLRQALDTARQALTIQSSNPDAALETLIRKWRHVSRQAAEQLFASAQDRVNCMGGVGAWRERNWKQTQEWDEEEPRNHKNLTEEQQDLIEDQKNEMVAKNRNRKLKEAVEERDDEVRPSSTPLTTCSRLMTIAITVFHHGHDAQDSQYRTQANRIQ
jgi:SEL1 protein